MPECFIEAYPSTRVILDCTEIFIETPSDFRVRSDTYSSYKCHNTAKGLLGITPNGFVSFVSDFAPGRVSDKALTAYSGLCNLLEPGDSVMADRGFLITEEVEAAGANLNIPPFLGGRLQLSLEDEVKTRAISKVRIHAERVIGQMKCFRILRGTFPNSMSKSLESIWKARPLRNSGSALIPFDGTTLPFHVGLGSFTVWVQPFRRQTWVFDTCHCIEYPSAQYPKSTQANVTTQRRQSPSSASKEKPASPPATPETSSGSASCAVICAQSPHRSTEVCEAED
ncbi:hypothetical protein HPB47_027345 [Ixodes persulcatus]|uniref:Uncharacterized protein n=1 Tax=Ixodes persulcatus TaxID=34615 RepID=A0AC60PXR4_IXOPE|nr:hypothetical protein HPB47_027345 [Ixodes persulcatus]